MVFPEGLKTVRWDREGKEIVEQDRELSLFLSIRCFDAIAPKQSYGEQEIIYECDRVTIDSMPDKLTPLCLEEWQEEHYNVMA